MTANQQPKIISIQETFRALLDEEAKAEARTRSRLFPLAVEAMKSLGLDIPDTDDTDDRQALINRALSIADVIQAAHPQPALDQLPAEIRGK